MDPIPAALFLHASDSIICAHGVVPGLGLDLGQQHLLALMSS